MPDGPYTVPIGEPALRNEGKDITLVGYAPQTSSNSPRAVAMLKQDGISADLIDPRTLAPLEGVVPMILKSVQKTGRLITSDDGSLHLFELHGDRGPGGRGPAGHEDQAFGVPRCARAGGPGDAQLHAKWTRPKSRRQPRSWLRADRHYGLAVSVQLFALQEDAFTVTASPTLAFAVIILLGEHC